MALDTFTGSKPTSNIIKEVDDLFDLLNSGNLIALGNKAPVSLQNLPVFLEKC